MNARTSGLSDTKSVNAFIASVTLWNDDTTISPWVVFKSTSTSSTRVAMDATSVSST